MLIHCKMASLLVCVILVLAACDTGDLSDDVDRKVGALSGVNTLGEGSRYAGGVGFSTGFAPNGLGTSPWGLAADPADCSRACGNLMDCAADETGLDSTDECVGPCVEALANGTSGDAQQIQCLSQAPSCSAVIRCLESPPGDGGSGIGSGSPGGNGIGAASSGGDGIGNSESDQGADSSSTTGDLTPSPAVGATNQNVDCDVACAGLVECFPGAISWSQCYDSCYASLDVGGGAEDYFACVADAGFSCSAINQCDF